MESRFRAFALMAALASFGSVAATESPPDPAPPLEALVAEALERSPALAALRAEVSARREMESPAGALPEMTVAAAFMGLLPIMGSTSAGADVMKRIAAPMIGGLVTSFLLELLVYPAIYKLWRGRSLGRLSSPPVLATPLPSTAGSP